MPRKPRDQDPVLPQTPPPVSSFEDGFAPPSRGVPKEVLESLEERDKTLLPQPSAATNDPFPIADVPAATEGEVPFAQEVIPVPPKVHHIKTLQQADPKELRALQPPLSVSFFLRRSGGAETPILPSDGDGKNLTAEGVMAANENLIRLAQAGAIAQLPPGGGTFRVHVSDATDAAVQWFFSGGPPVSQAPIGGTIPNQVPFSASPPAGGIYPQIGSQGYGGPMHLPYTPPMPSAPYQSPYGLGQTIYGQPPLPMPGWGPTLFGQPSTAPSASDEALRREVQALREQAMRAEFDKNSQAREAAWNAQISQLVNRVESLTSSASARSAGDDPSIVALREQNAALQRRLEEEAQRRREDDMRRQIDDSRKATEAMFVSLTSKIESAGSQREDPMLSYLSRVQEQQTNAAIKATEAEVRRLELQMQAERENRMRPQDVIAMARDLVPKDGTAELTKQMGGMLGTVFSAMKSIVELQAAASSGSGGEPAWVKVVSDVLGQGGAIAQQAFAASAAKSEAARADAAARAANANLASRALAAPQALPALSAPPATEPTGKVIPMTAGPTNGSGSGVAASAPNPEDTDGEDEGTDDTSSEQAAWQAKDEETWGAAHQMVVRMRRMVSLGEIEPSQVVQHLLQAWMLYGKIPGMAIPAVEMLMRDDYVAFVKALLPDPPSEHEALVVIVEQFRKKLVEILSTEIPKAKAAPQPQPSA